MDSIFATEGYKTQRFNALNTADTDAQGNARTGLDTTVRDVSINLCVFLGYLIHNNDSATRWVQVFYAPASEITLGTTPPDFTIMVGANGSVAWDMFRPINRATRGLSVACTTEEVGTTGPTAAATGVILYAEQGVV